MTFIIEANRPFFLAQRQRNAAVSTPYATGYSASTHSLSCGDPRTSETELHNTLID